jgi:hypothetical protein
LLLPDAGSFFWSSGTPEKFQRRVKQVESAVQADASFRSPAKRQVAELYPQLVKEILKGHLKNKPGLE